MRPALLNVREMCWRISDMSLSKIDKSATYTLKAFKAAQMDMLNEVSCVHCFLFTTRTVIA